MKNEIKEIKINKANGSIAFINNGIVFSQFGIAKEILDLITNLQKENEINVDKYNDLFLYFEDYKSKCEKLELENKLLKEQMVAMVQPNYVYGIELQGVGKDE